MIIIEFSLTNPDNVILKKSIREYGIKYPDILDVCGEFIIKIDEQIFFNEPQFPVVEFIVFLDKWTSSRSKTKDMLFYSIETEDNPLIQFRLEKDMFHIFSPWQLFSSHELFTKQELLEAINELMESLDEQLALGYSVEFN
jgi:hypothetical protein